MRSRIPGMRSSKGKGFRLGVDAEMIAIVVAEDDVNWPLRETLGKYVHDEGSAKIAQAEQGFCLMKLRQSGF